MTIAKSPSMPFYGKQFYDDESVWLSSLAHQGLYVALLWNQWQHGSIPADLSLISRLVGQPEKDVRKLWEIVGKHFAPRTDDDSRLFNAPLEKIRDDAAKLRERRSNAGSNGGSKRASKTEANGVANHQANLVPPNGEAKAIAVASSEKVVPGNFAPTDPDFDAPRLFEEAFAAYPLPTQRSLAMQEYARTVKSVADHRLLMSAITTYRAYATEHKQAWMGAGRFFGEDWRAFVDAKRLTPSSSMPKRVPVLRREDGD